MESSRMIVRDMYSTYLHFDDIVKLAGRLEME